MNIHEGVGLMNIHDSRWSVREVSGGCGSVQCIGLHRATGCVLSLVDSTCVRV